MELGTLGVKCEMPRPQPQFCHACFSVNRTLQPLHQDNVGVFYDLLGLHSTTVLTPSPSLCWECRSLLRRAASFRRKANAVQAYLRHYQLNQGSPIPPSLSTLGAADSPKEISVEHKPALVGPPVDDIKLELPATPPDQLAQMVCSMKEELDDELQNDGGDWQSDDDAPKGTTQIPPTDDTTTPTEWCKKRRKPRRTKYIRRTKSDISIDKFCENVPVDEEQLRALLEQERGDEAFLRYPHRCDTCVRGWRTAGGLEAHVKKRHSKSAGPFQCAICLVRVPHKGALSSHVSAHYVARQCVACRVTRATRRSLARHVVGAHADKYECRHCPAVFSTVREFFRHDAALHRVFQCDQCGKRCGSRRAIRRHLAKHGPFICHQCANRPLFASSASLSSHRALKHPPALPRPELAYCVECDRQFDSVLLFRKHLTSAVAHRKTARRKQIPCPVCGKIYARKTTMKAHYNYVHMKQSNYVCRECDLIFLNRTKYVCHMRRRHENYQQPRDKLCTLCGRGFTTNRILENHVRTHTGERPFACTHCDAKFSQKIALKTHVKHIHLKVKRQPAPQLKYFD